MTPQQTVLRVETNASSVPTYEFLDIYGSIPIQVNKVYADLQNISNKNSDYVIDLQIPGTKKNNRFFESFFDVDTETLYFNPTQKIPADVLINDESFFKGFVRLNKVSVKNSIVEYDISLYSLVADLFGAIGNNLLKDLNFDDSEYKMNHTFSLSAVTENITNPIFSIDAEKPTSYFYPIVHNGYIYSGDSVNFTGGTTLDQTRLYTSSGPIGTYNSLSGFTAAGGLQYRINTPTQGLFDNQLKAALSVWNLIKLMFKTYGYYIKSDFFNTPWFKALYTYGYFSANETKFGYTVQSINTYPASGVVVYFDCPISGSTFGQFNAIITTPSGIPCYCSQDITIHAEFYDTNFPYYPYNYIIDAVIKSGTSGYTENTGLTWLPRTTYSPDVPTGTILSYFPKQIGDTVVFLDGMNVDFSLVIDTNIKQIDFLSSIAKKFNLIFYANPNTPKEIIIEPFSYYVGTGNIYDWTQKLSFDEGFTVEPALNYIDSNIILSDLEDGDYGNQQFKQRNNRVYGTMFYYGPTTYRSTTGKTETIFSPEVFRSWDTPDQVPNGGIKLPLGINYSASSNTSQSNGGINVKQNFTYTGTKTKPKLIYNLGTSNVFLDTLGEIYDNTKPYKSYTVSIGDSSGNTVNQFENITVVADTMPIGMADQFKINNDSLSLLFNSELVSILPPATFNTYTKESSYARFYQNRIDNIYNSATRFLTGKFYLKLNDYKDLTPKDLVKIKNQYFIWNKINNYNLTDTTLTEVELVQINNTPSTYPTRYFKYQYCDNPTVTFKFKTDFTNPNILNTNFGFSIAYDHNCGTLYSTGTPSGYTSSFTYQVTGTTYYVGYTINEISEDDYLNLGYCDWSNDTLHNYIWSVPNAPYNTAMPTYWLNSGATVNGLNLFSSCANFSSTASTYSIRLGSSEYFGANTCINKLLTTEIPENINTQDNNNLQTQ